MWSYDPGPGNFDLLFILFGKPTTDVDLNQFTDDGKIKFAEYLWIL